MSGRISYILFLFTVLQFFRLTFRAFRNKINKVALWAASYSACVVYTKTIIHLSVGESGGYLPSHFVSIHLHFGVWLVCSITQSKINIITIQ